MRLVFAGTPEFALPSLAALIASEHEVAAVMTQADRPAGRGRKLRASPVKQAALGADLPVLQPRSLRDADSQADLRRHEPDLIIVIAFGMLLPPEVLTIPRHGCWNIHASLLPRWRGAAPIHRAILSGDDQTGVCLMKMDAGLDTGPILGCEQTTIKRDDDTQTLHDRLARLGADLLLKNVDRLAAGDPPQARAQIGQATYAKKLRRAEGQMDLTESASVLHRQIRAFNPFPVATLTLQGQPLKVFRAKIVAGQPGAAPGSLIEADNGHLIVQCGEDALCLLQVQAPGKQRMTGADFLRGWQPQSRASSDNPTNP